MPAVVSTTACFDELLVARDHPSRRPTDTYYVDESTVLRAHTTAHDTELLRRGLRCFLVSGDVYRRDAIDRKHYPRGLGAGRSEAHAVRSGAALVSVSGAGCGGGGGGRSGGRDGWHCHRRQRGAGALGGCRVPVHAPLAGAGSAVAGRVVGGARLRRVAAGCAARRQRGPEAGVRLGVRTRSGASGHGAVRHPGHSAVLEQRPALHQPVPRWRHHPLPAVQQVSSSLQRHLHVGEGRARRRGLQRHRGGRLSRERSLRVGALGGRRPGGGHHLHRFVRASQDEAPQQLLPHHVPQHRALADRRGDQRHAVSHSRPDCALHVQSGRTAVKRAQGAADGR
eukprot:ctg_1642.g407